MAKKTEKPVGLKKKPEQLNLHLERYDCSHSKKCAAPLCPKDVNFGKGVWFPYEPVCRLKDAPDWVKKQRQISRLKGVSENEYFTFRMLKTIDVVRSGLQGANPDHVTAERIWFDWYLGRSRKKQTSVAADSEAGATQPQMEGL